MEAVTFDYYQREYHGTRITSNEDFLSAEVKAAAYVAHITFGRSRKENPLSEDVKNAICAAAEIFASREEHEGINSESNDGYSVTYSKSGEADKDLLHTVQMFLPQELLYRGLCE